MTAHMFSLRMQERLRSPKHYQEEIHAERFSFRSFGGLIASENDISSSPIHAEQADLEPDNL